MSELRGRPVGRLLALLEDVARIMTDDTLAGRIPRQPEEIISELMEADPEEIISELMEADPSLCQDDVSDETPEAD